MHILPLPHFFLAWAVSDQRSIKNRQSKTSILAKIREALTPIEDQWSLESLEGETFEDVEIEDLRDGVIVIKHSVGKTRIPIALLSENSQKKLRGGLNAGEPYAAEKTGVQLGAAAPSGSRFRPAAR